MLYPLLFQSMEAVRWDLGKDIPWDIFDRTLISERQLHGIKMNAILEWAAMPTTEMFLRDNPHDVDFAAFMSIWFYEEQKHSLVLMEYLRRFSPSHLPTKEELAAVRFTFDSAPLMDSLALHFCGEVRLNQWYRCAMEAFSEPLIRHIYKLIAADEARHARAYLDYMKEYIDRHDQEAKLAFTKIGVLMANPRINRAMHPTQLHVNKDMFPNDTVNSKLPDPEWIEKFLSDEIHFDDHWEAKVSKGILQSYSLLLGKKFDSASDLRDYRKSLQ